MIGSQQPDEQLPIKKEIKLSNFIKQKIEELQRRKEIKKQLIKVGKLLSDQAEIFETNQIYLDSKIIEEFPINLEEIKMTFENGTSSTAVKEKLDKNISPTKIVQQDTQPNINDALEVSKLYNEITNKFSELLKLLNDDSSDNTEYLNIKKTQLWSRGWDDLLKQNFTSFILPVRHESMTLFKVLNNLIESIDNQNDIKNLMDIKSQLESISKHFNKEAALKLYLENITEKSNKLNIPHIESFSNIKLTDFCSYYLNYFKKKELSFNENSTLSHQCYFLFEDSPIFLVKSMKYQIDVILFFMLIKNIYSDSKNLLFPDILNSFIKYLYPDMTKGMLLTEEKIFIKRLNEVEGVTLPENCINMPFVEYIDIILKQYNMKIISKTDIKDMKIIIKDYESSPTSMITTSSPKLNFHTLSTYCNLCEQKSLFFDNYNTQEVFNNEKLDVMKNVYNSLMKIETQGQNQSITKNYDISVIGGPKPPKPKEIHDVVYNGDKILQIRNYSGFSSLKNRVLFGPLLILEHISIGFTKKSVKTENKSIKTYKHNEKERCAKIISLYARSGIDLENIKDVEYNIVDLYNHLYDKNVEEITDIFKIIRTAKKNNIENPNKFYLIDKYNKAEKVITFKNRQFIFYSNYELKLKKIKNEHTNVLILKSIYKATDEWITIYAANLLIKKKNAAKLIETEAAEKMSENLLSNELSSEKIINNADSLITEQKFNLEINKVIKKGDERINKAIEDYAQQLLNEKIDTKSKLIAQIDTNKQIPTIVKFEDGVDVYKDNLCKNLNLNDTATKKKVQSNPSNYNYGLDFNIKYQPFIYDNEDMTGKNLTEKKKFTTDRPDTNLMFNNKLVISTPNSKEAKLLENNTITSESVKNEGDTEKAVKSETGTETEAGENISLKLIKYSCLLDDSKTPLNAMPFFRPFMTLNDMKKLRKAQRGDFILTPENGQLMICISINKNLTISAKIIRSNEKYMLFQNPELFNTINELLSYYTKNDMHFKGKLA